MDFLKSLLFVSLAYNFNAFSMPMGPSDVGVSTSDKQFIFPTCGVYRLSKKVQAPGCILGFDFYQIAMIKKINTYELVQMTDSDNLNLESLTPYHYNNGLMALSSSKLDWFDSEKNDEKIASNNKVKLVLSDLKNTTGSHPIEYAEGKGFEVSDVNACWQVFALKNSIAAICADSVNVYFVEYSVFGETRVPILTAAEIGVKKAYFAFPHLKLDENNGRLVKDQVQENLGNSRLTFKKGYLDLKTKKYILE